MSCWACGGEFVVGMYTLSKAEQLLTPPAARL
jgi:hypothetical protein